MDEPLSNLDAKLRVSMRASLNQLHERLGVTTVYVTHDQVEAMTLGDRVCVLRDGMLQQVDTPQNLFDQPGQPVRRRLHRLARDELRQRRAGPRRRRRASPSPASGCRSRRRPSPSKPGLDQYFGREIILGIRPSDFEDADSQADAAAGRACRSRAERHRGARLRDQRDLPDRRPAGRAQGHRRRRRRRRRRGGGAAAGRATSRCGPPGSTPRSPRPPRPDHRAGRRHPQPALLRPDQRPGHRPPRQHRGRR